MYEYSSEQVPPTEARFDSSSALLLSAHECDNFCDLCHRIENAPPRWLGVCWLTGFSEISTVIYQHQISVTTNGSGDMHDLTEKVASFLHSTGVQAGLVNIFNIGSTAAVGTIEFEPGLERDLPSILNKLIPPSLDYGHEQTWHDGNGHSHLQATLLGPSLTVPISDGKLVLGTWQQIFHLECDVRGRQRMVMLTIIGE
jgi:secondary thiamine-phosphate synthase enzyme